MIQIRYNEMENSSSSKDKNKIEAKGKIIMANITIIKGEEFKIAVKEKIKKDDLFMEQYERAAGMLDKIVRTSAETQREKDLWSWKSQDFENNIIAFCGERGEGKSSVMITFVNALYQDRNNEIFTKCKNLINTNFAEPIVIDPSLFDPPRLMAYIMYWILFWQSFFVNFMNVIITIISTQRNERGKIFSIVFSVSIAMFRSLIIKSRCWMMSLTMKGISAS